MSKYQGDSKEHGKQSQSASKHGGHQGSHQGKRELPDAIQVQKFLAGMDYPADKQTILKKAEEEGADSHVMEVLQGLPDRDFDSPTAVSREVSKMH